MKCPECEKQGLKSNVFHGSGSTTDMYCPEFYDEEGKLHHHDMNTITQSFNCSNGHSWVSSYHQPCWCGWPVKKKESK